jgi:alginate O-acetyltransferase complex protein AlgI
MLFNSFEFLFFFPVVTALFFLFSPKFRWGLLLAASCFFYMFFKPEYILILIFTIIIDYYAGIFIQQANHLSKKRQFLIASLIANIGVLAIFKYYNFINGNITSLGNMLGFTNKIPALGMILPIGLSFHTFQAMSYTIEVYRGHQKAEKHIGIYALYVMFYPQLVAGPIERPQNMLPQFHSRQSFNYENLAQGLNLIAYGFFKKLVVADRLSVFVNQVYSNIDDASSSSMLITVCFFSIQIYCDFSGYSDIARGTAKCMGFDLMINFSRPYLSQSVSEFWRRWHISLSTWFKDYLYIPLGGSREGKSKGHRNLLIVFLVSGLWHGANWTFVVWGALHGFYVVAGSLSSRLRSRLNSLFYLNKSVVIHKFVNRCIVFALVTFAWIFFRAHTIKEASKVIRKIFSFDFSLNLTQLSAEKGPLNLFLSMVVIVILGLSYYLPSSFKLKNSTFFLIVTTFIIIIAGKNVGSEFIYFQF